MSLLESEFKNGGMFGHDNGFWNDTPEELAEYGVVTDTYDPDQMFVEWLQSKFPEGKTINYLGNQYQGTKNVESSNSATTTDAKPITLENSNASQNAEGTNKSETKEASTLEKTETGNETSSDKIDDEDPFWWIPHLNNESDTKDKTNTKDKANT